MIFDKFGDSGARAMQAFSASAFAPDRAPAGQWQYPSTAASTQHEVIGGAAIPLAKISSFPSAARCRLDVMPLSLLALDLDRAVALYEQACDGGEMGGCRNLGVMYDNGSGVEQDLGRAVALYRQACDGGNMGGCSRRERLSDPMADIANP